MVVLKRLQGVLECVIQSQRMREFRHKRATGLVSVLLRFGCFLGCQGQRKIVKFCASASACHWRNLSSKHWHNFWNEASSVIAVSLWSMPILRASSGNGDEMFRNREAKSAPLTSRREFSRDRRRDTRTGPPDTCHPEWEHEGWFEQKWAEVSCAAPSPSQNQVHLPNVYTEKECHRPHGQQQKSVTPEKISK